MITSIKLNNRFLLECAQKKENRNSIVELRCKGAIKKCLQGVVQGVVNINILYLFLSKYQCAKMKAHGLFSQYIHYDSL